MKISLFCTTRYIGPAVRGTWPVPTTQYEPEIAQSSMQLTLDQAKLADEVGFDWISVAEHHFAPFAMTPNPMVMAGAMSQVVKRAKIALLGPDLPILNPLRVAEELAMLDTMTGGRIIAGLMRGTPNEYVTYNINPNESRDRFAEAVKLIRRAWTEKQPFGWEGRYYQYRSISIWPRPVQEPHPPIYMSGSSEQSGKFAADNQLGLGFAVTTLPAATKSANYYRDQAVKAGWEPQADDIIYRLGMHIADTDEEAISDIVEAGADKPRAGITLMNMAVLNAVQDSKYYGKDTEKDRESNIAKHGLEEKIELGELIVGSPETVISQIKKIHNELGPGILDVISAVQLGERTNKSLALMGTKVMPQIKDW